MVKQDTSTLYIYIPSEHQTLRAFYRNRIEDHNAKVYTTHPDAGFDLAIPNDMVIAKPWGNKLPLNIHCAMVSPTGASESYYLYPRSSISKTPIRLANSVGIIDSGYRGVITAMVDCFKSADNTSSDYVLNAMERYFQICHASLGPFKVILVDNIDELGTTTRGDGGFGSTGR